MHPNSTGRGLANQVRLKGGAQYHSGQSWSARLTLCVGLREHREGDHDENKSHVDLNSETQPLVFVDADGKPSRPELEP